MLLSAAAQRQDGAVELGPKLKGSASRNVIANCSATTWSRKFWRKGAPPGGRRDEDKGALALRITKRGLAAIGADQGAEAGAAEAHQPDQGDKGTAPALAKSNVNGQNITAVAGIVTGNVQGVGFRAMI